MFGKLYRRSFLEKYNIRFNVSLSNEDTGFNQLITGCTDRIWFIPKDVYIWHFKANSITRIRQGMYGQDSGYKGYLDNMCWTILELQKRTVNKNNILGRIMDVMCTLYHFHVENMQRYPMNTEISMNWIRGYYELVYKPNEQYITETMLLQSFANCAAGHNIASKGIIPKITFFEFMEQVKAKPMIVDPTHEVGGATPAGYIPPITSPDWPVEVHEYIDQVEDMVNIDSDTNKSRYGGMNKLLGIKQDDTAYDMNYTGEKENKSIDITVPNPIIYNEKEHFDFAPKPTTPGPIIYNGTGFEWYNSQPYCTISNSNINKKHSPFNYTYNPTDRCEGSCTDCSSCNSNRIVNKKED